jgi:hypothetical protein
MNNYLSKTWVIILIFVVGVMFGWGVWSGAKYTNVKNIYNLVLSKLKMIEENAVVQSVNNGKYVFLTDKGLKEVTDITRVPVAMVSPSGGYLQANWNLVTPGTQVKIAIEKSTGKIRAVLVL